MARGVASFDVTGQMGAPLDAGAGEDGATLSFSRRWAPGEEVVKSFVSEGSQSDVRVFCGIRCTGNMRVLALTAALFMTITIAQTVGALIANSLALLVDCASMGIDSLTYLANIVSETQRGKRHHQLLELCIAATSIVALVGFTIYVLVDALPRLQGGGEDDDDVNPAIVLGFAIWGIVFDVVSLFAFIRNERKTNGGAGINMLAAFAHVAADLARSMTTLVESILIQAFKFDSGKTDAWACIIVSATILLGAMAATVEFVKELRRYCRGNPEEGAGAPLR